MITSAPGLPPGTLFRPMRAVLADHPDDTTFTPLDPVDLEGLASLLRSREDCRSLRVRLCVPGHDDAPLVLCRGSGSWTVFRPTGGGVLAEIKFSSDEESRMKTLADIKRRAVPGARLEVVEQTKKPVLVGTVRTIVKTSASSLTFTSDNTGADEYNQPWPKAAAVRILDSDTFEYDLPVPAKGCIIRLRFIPEG